jgi:hypothetical protein
MKWLNSHPLFYATIGYDLSFNKKKVLSRKKKGKNEFDCPDSQNGQSN